MLNEPAVILLKLLVEYLAMAVNGWVSPGGLDGPSSLTFFKAKKFAQRENKTVTINSTKSPIIESKEEENWTNFARQSTCAAVMHLGSRSQPIPVKIVWGIALIIGIFLTAVSTYHSTMDFMNLTGSSESIIQPNPPFQNEHPRYHICISNTFNLTILAEMGFVDSDMISYLMVSFSLFVVSPFFLNNIEYQERLEAKFNDIMINHNIKDVSEIVHKALLRCDEIIVGCIYYGANLDGVECCAKYFPNGSFLSPSGACVSTNGAPVINQVIPSSSFGFLVIVKDLSQPRASLDSSIINPVTVNQKGVYFTVSDSATNALIALFQQKQYTRFGLWTLIAMSKTIVNDEEKLSSVIVRKACANPKEPDTYRHLVASFQNYTEENCLYAGRQKTINQALGCFIVTFPYEGNLPPCSPFQLLKFAKRITERILSPNKTSPETECVSDCWKETYSISASYADLQITTNFTFGNWTISPDKINQIAILNFYYPKFETTLLINHYPTISGWLGILGGNLGLFLGASMVTLIEVLVFCFSCCRSSKPY